MKEKKKGNGLVGFISLCLGLGTGILCGILFVSYLDAVEGPDAGVGLYWLRYTALILLLYLAYILQLAIHEAGHLVFGLLTGYRFSSYRFLCFMWLRENGKLRLRLMSVAGTAGQCLMAPPELKQGKFPVMLYNLGGCLMNLIAAALSLGFGLLLGVGSLTGVFFLLLAVTGLLCALLNGIPMRTKMVDNDGRNALSARKDPYARQAFWLQMKIGEQMAQGVRVKDMPEAWFSMPPEADRKNVLVSTIDVFACERLLDERRFAEAEQMMAWLLGDSVTLLGLHRRLLTCNRIYCELVGENRKEVLDMLRTKEQIAYAKAMKRDPSVLRTEYAYALKAERNPARAKLLAEQFEKLVKTYPYTGDVQTQRELMEIARARALKAEI